MSAALARRMAAPALLAVLVAVLAQVPLLHNRAFYFWDDSAAQFIPTWRHIGEQLRAGTFPTMSPELWAGGNLAAEALFGLWNPLCLLAAVVVSLVPNLAVAAATVKTCFLVVMALGGYGVAREYGAGRAAAVVAGAALPFAGFTLYFDASSWASGLIATSMVPHLWWTTRRSARGALSPLVPFAAGYLTITTGNPYAAVGAVLVFGALLVEFGVRRCWPGVRRTLLSAVATGLCIPIVYLPLLAVSSITVRAGGRLGNDGFMVPGLADVLNLSTPTFLPYVTSFGHPYFTLPVSYLAWWVLPLAPWLRWRRLSQRWHELAGVAVFGGVALLISVAPAYVWMFRWPIRVLPFVGLALLVAVAVVLTGGLRSDHWRRRAAASGAIVLAGAYLAFAARPDRWPAHLAGTALVLGLTAVVLWLGVRRWPGRPGPIAALLVATGAIVLVMQTTLFPANANVTRYDFPTSVAQLHRDFGDRYPGTVLQVGESSSITGTGRAATAWRHLLFGTMLHAAGVDSVNAYTGMRHRAFSSALCLRYQGTVCPDVLNRLWAPRADGRPPLADLLELDTVVVQNDLAGLPPFQPPAGWATAERNDVVTVYRRTGPTGWPDSRVSAVSGGVSVTPVESSAKVERLRLRADSAGSVTLARLAWPGYQASLDGVELPVTSTEEGLLVVDVPAGSSGELTIRWTLPGRTIGLLALGVAVMLAIAHTVVSATRRRRRPLHA